MVYRSGHSSEPRYISVAPLTPTNQHLLDIGNASAHLSKLFKEQEEWYHSIDLKLHVMSWNS
jgi:hypothetical protein